MQNEESLVERAKHHDHEAFARLYEEHFDKIYRYLVLKVGDRTEAEDMTQQVFLKALQAISSFRWKGVSFSAWLFRIAHNLVIDFLRRKAKRTTVTLDESLAAGDSAPEVVVEQKLDIERLALATQQLTSAQREVIALRFAGDLSVAEVAEVMKRSQGAVKALQHSAIASLRKGLSRGSGHD